MRCNICDKLLTEAEISFNPAYEAYDPCGFCLDVIENVFGDHLTEEEVTELLADEFPEEFAEKT